MKQGFVVAIDGPVASGKGTVATLLASKINAVKIDTGGMYRALALKCVKENIPFTSEDQVVHLLSHTHITLVNDSKGELSAVSLDGEVVNDSIRTPQIAHGASIVSKYQKVRQHLVQRQKEIIKQATSEGRSVIVEGRIVASEVVPDAEYKLFLTATLSIRAKRRFEQYQEKGAAFTLEEVIRDTKERDDRDAKYLPENPEELGYRVLDTSEMREEETIAQIVNDLQERKLLHDSY